MIKKSFDIVLLTDNRLINDSPDNHIHNAYYEDSLVAKALKSEGLKVTRKAWDDNSFDWSSTKSVMFRTTWDYHNRFEEFSQWLNRVSKQTVLINSEELIRWNVDKHYLLDLKSNGVLIPETEIIEIGSSTTLKMLHEKLGWEETVLKPCISAGAYNTYRLNLNNLEEHEIIFKELIKKEAMMLQPFQHNIVAKGEVSMMVINGQFSHAILKTPKKGDYRVQDDFGGAVHKYTPTQEEIHFAESITKACLTLPLYARVDIFINNNDELAVLELELIEPEMWFRHYPKAANLMAIALKNKLNNLNS